MVRDNRSTFAKSAENIAKRFEREVFKFYDADGSCTLEEATRQARLEHPALFRALQALKPRGGSASRGIGNAALVLLHGAGMTRTAPPS